MPAIHPRFQLTYLISSILLASGAIYIGFNIWYSIATGLIFWLITIVSYPSLEFSPDGRYMRNYYGLFQFKFGIWQKIPLVIGITIKQLSEMICKDSKYNAGIWDSSPRRYKELIVMLSTQNSTDGIIIARFSINESKRAIKLAAQFAKHFGVPINSYLLTN